MITLYYVYKYAFRPKPISDNYESDDDDDPSFDPDSHTDSDTDEVRYTEEL